jgi:DNA-binding transcriptional ArsR family regulator
MNKFAALSDPNRRRIVGMLGLGPLSAGQLVERFNISQPAISQHLKVLKTSGLVVCSKKAQKRIYELSPSGFREIEQWVQNVSEFWNSNLDKLEEELNKNIDKK